MYGVVNTAHNSELFIWKLLEECIFTLQEKTVVTVWETDAKQMYWGGHFTVCTYGESGVGCPWPVSWLEHRPTGRCPIHVSLSHQFFFWEREGKEERGEKHQFVKETLMGCLSHPSTWGPGPQPRHVPWLGIELANLGFAGWHSIHWGQGSQSNVSLSLCLSLETNKHILSWGFSKFLNK